MKKIIIITLTVLITSGITIFTLSLINKKYSPTALTINELDSRTRMSEYEIGTGPIKSGALPPSSTATDALKAKIPYSSSSFSIIWNNQTNRADVYISQPYDQNISLLLTWLGQNKASNLPSGTLNVIKRQSLTYLLILSITITSSK